jgi:probable rRNA maturation factor
MNHVVDVGAEGVRVPLARHRVVEIARTVLRRERIRAAQLSITFVDNRRIAKLNRGHLNHRGATDVISFALSPASVSAPLVGDIYIAPEVARRNAQENGITAREELTRLVVHGVLHVVGFDHPAGEERRTSPMWKRQEALVRALTGIRSARRSSGSRGRTAA